MRITKDMVFSVDRGTDAELAQTLAVFERDGILWVGGPRPTEIKMSLIDWKFVVNEDGKIRNSKSNNPTNYTPSEFLARFGSVDDAAVSNHDDHYQRIEARGVEPIAVMESIVCAGLPEQFHAVAKRNLSLALGVKYALRLGEKDVPEKELDKMDNYLHRARKGEWRQR